MTSSAIEHCVLLTRPAGSNENLRQLLEHHGISTVTHPMLVIEPIQLSPLDKNFVLNLDQFDDIIFISRNAVRFGVPLLEQYWPQWPELNWYAVGKSTADELQRFLIQAEYPLRASSEGLLALPGLQEMKNRKVLIVRGTDGRELLADELGRRGAEVQYLGVYDSACPAHDSRLSRDIEETGVDIAVVTSLASLVNLGASLNASEIGKLQLVVPSERIASAAVSWATQGVHIAPGVDDEALVLEILKLTRRSPGN